MGNLGVGWGGGGGTESLFSKSRCWTLRAPFFVCVRVRACAWPFLRSRHCLLLLHVERHQPGRNGKFYFLHKEFQITAEVRVWGEIVNNSILSSNKSVENEPCFGVGVKICWLRDIKWKDGFAQGNCFEFFHRAPELSFLKPSPPRWLDFFYFVVCRCFDESHPARRESAGLLSLKTGNDRRKCEEQIE